MKYAKFISETEISTTFPKKGYDAQGRLVTGNLEYRPDVLELLHFYPLVEQEMPSEVIEGHHYEKRYRLDSGVVEPETDEPVVEEPTQDENEQQDGQDESGQEESGGQDEPQGAAARDDGDEPSEQDGGEGGGEGDGEPDPEPQEDGGESDEPDAPGGDEPEPAPQPQVRYTVVQYWVSVEDPPAPPEPTKVYSKLKILIAADQAGFAEDLMDMIESDRKTKYIWDASNTIENNALLQSYLPGIAQALNKTEQEVVAFLDTYCLAD